MFISYIFSSFPEYTSESHSVMNTRSFACSPRDRGGEVPNRETPGKTGRLGITDGHPLLPCNINTHIFTLH